MATRHGPGPAAVDLYWLPLGAGDNTHLVRHSGRLYERLLATWQRRQPRDLYHSALEVSLDDHTYAIEMAPVWRADDPARGVVAEGAVGHRWLGRSRLFRYEVRRWRDGAIPDADEAVESPRRLSRDTAQADRLLELVPACPTLVWGRDERRTGDMWNSNSLISWVLASSGHDLTGIAPPGDGRAPGWDAGALVAAMS